MPIQLVGDIVPELHTTKDLWIKVQLNKEVAAAEVNKNKKDPVHYANVKNQTFANAVLVTAGSCIEFRITSKGRLGFGYSIVGGLELDARNRVVSDKHPQVIVRKLYCFPPTTPDNIRKLQESTTLIDVVQRYQDASQSMIKIEGFKTLNFAPDDRGAMVAMMNCTVTSWEVLGFIDDETDIDYGRPADLGPQMTGRVNAGAGNISAGAGNVTAGIGNVGDATPSPTSAAGGGPIRGGKSGQAFKKARNIREVEVPDDYVNFSFLIERN